MKQSCLTSQGPHAVFSPCQYVRLLTLAAVLGASGLVAPAAIVTWDGGGDGLNWSDPLNWSGDTVPTAGDDAVLPAGVTVNLTGAQVVRSVTAARGLSIASGSLTVVGGSSSLSGAVTVALNAWLSASGTGTILTVSGPVAADGASLAATGGAQLRLPTLTNYAKPDGCYDVVFQASGAGSVLDLPALTQFYGGNCAWLRLQATDGGSVVLSNLVAITDGWAQASADGPGSSVQLPKLASFGSADRWLSLEAYNGGQVLTPLFPGTSRTGVGLNAGGVLSTNQFKRLGGVTVSGMALAFPAVTNVDGANLVANAGASLAFPLVRQVTKPDGCYDVDWKATGPGAVLNLSAVTNLYGGNCAWLRIQAQSSGSIVLSNLVAMADGFVQAYADGAGSLVDLRRLVSFPSLDRWLSLEAYNGGQVLTPLFLGGPRVGLGLSNGGGLSTNQLTRVGWVTVGGMALTLPAVTNVDGASLIVNAGGSLALPLVRRVTKPDGCYDVNWTANGLGAVLNLSPVTNLYGGNCAWLRIQAQAGGSIVLSNLVAMADGFVQAYADGAGSLVDLRKLASFPSLDRWLSLEAYNGGQVLTPQLTDGSRIGLGLSSDGQLNTSQFYRLAGVTLGGMALTLSGVTNVDGASVTVNAGGSLALPLVRQINKPDGCYDANWYANGAGALIDLSAVTNLYAGNCAWLRFASSGGGQIVLSNVVTVSDGYMIASADGADSRVDLRKLTRFPSVDRWLSLEAYNGGEVLTSVFAGGARVGIGVSSGGLLSTNQFQRLGGITLSGMALTLPAVTNVDGASCTVNAGGNLALPLVRQINKPDGCYDMNWYANGVGSVINLAPVTHAYGGNCAWLRFQAWAGGQIILSNLVAATNGQFIFRAEDAGSAVDLRQLASFPATDRWLSLEAVNSGLVMCSNLIGGARVGVTLANGGLMPLAQFQRLGGLAVSGGAATFAGLTNLDGAGVTASAGGTVALPALQLLTKSPGCYDMTWNAEGSGCRIDAPALQSVATTPACGWLRLWATAGGQFNLSNVVSITGQSVEVLADGPGSVMDLSRLVSFTSPGPGAAALTAQNGGVILLGTQAFLLANVNLNLPPGNPVLPPVVVSGPNLSLYGTPWHSYLVEQRSALNPAAPWTPFDRVALTNAIQPIYGAPPANTAFRVTEFVANPALLDLRRVTGGQVQLILFGPPGNRYDVQANSALAPGATWPTLTTFSLTNSFRILPWLTPTNAAEFYRARQL